MNARAGWLDVAPQPVFAIFHPAPGDVGVLLLPPFGWEEVASYRARRDWADHLAAQGHPALRMDLPGTGDSGGTPLDDDLAAAWTAAATAGATYLRTEGGCSRVVAVGIGMGGFVAVRAVSAGAPIDDLVLWSVPGRGRNLVRELHAFARMQATEIANAGAPEPEPPPGAPTVAGGFALSASLEEDLRAVTLNELELRGAGRRALLLGRDGTTPDPKFAEHLSDEGWTVTVGPGVGWASMTDVPHAALAPETTFAEVDAWLADAPEGTIPVDVPAPAFADHVLLDGGRVRERVLRVEQPYGEAFGVVAEPTDGSAAGRPAVVLLNAGAIRRIGPNRMWVEAARRWAAEGTASLRLDLSGIGDADGDSTGYATEIGLYVPEFLEQVERALDAVARDGGPDRFLLTGLCAGAYWAFHSAGRDARVDSAFLLNSRVLFWDDDEMEEREVRRVGELLLRPRSWGRIVRGDVGLDRIGAGIKALVVGIRRSVAGLVRRLRGAPPAPTDTDAGSLDRALDALGERGATVVLAFSGAEPLHAELTRSGHLARADHWPGLRIEELPGFDHTLRPLRAQQAAHAALDAWVREQAAGG